MSEGEKPATDSLNVMGLQRRIAELEEHNRQLNKESAKHRLKAKEYRAKAEEAAKASATPAAELERLKAENRTLKLQREYDGAAAERGVKPGKARDTLFALLGDVKEG